MWQPEEEDIEQLRGDAAMIAHSFAGAIVPRETEPLQALHSSLRAPSSQSFKVGTSASKKKVSCAQSVSASLSPVAMKVKS